MKEDKKCYFVEFANINDLNDHKEEIERYSTTVETEHGVYFAVAEAALQLGHILGEKCVSFCLSGLARVYPDRNNPHVDFYRS